MLESCYPVGLSKKKKQNKTYDAMKKIKIHSCGLWKLVKKKKRSFHLF
jgi:hypothetical protein